MSDGPIPPQRGWLERSVVRVNKKFGALIDRQIPEVLLADPESARHAKLITRFGALGSLFGVTYAGFYLAIGHDWGATIILLCTLGVVMTPPMMRVKKSVNIAGNFFSLTLTLGFLGLCFVEGGMKGHAVAWLVTVPLCALLLLGTKGAVRWVVISFLAMSLVAALDLKGVRMPMRYDAKWVPLVETAGYLGLVVFMFILGVVFEVGRAQAQSKLQAVVAKLAASNDRLLHLNNEKNEFMGIAAHDLKNPLTVIAISAETLPNTTDPAVIAKLAGSIGAAANRMRTLVTDLLDANAIEEGRFASQITCCDMNALVQQCVEHNQMAADKKHIEICTGYSDKVLAKADRSATAQILENLISNALKFSPPNTKIHVHTLPEKDNIMVTVRDEGPGISDEDQKKLFKKFSRLSAQPTGGESSTGLGLSIVKRLAEAMSGSVQCHSAPGAGATFMLRLPLWPANEEVPKPPSGPASPAKAPTCGHLPKISSRNVMRN